MKLHKIALLSLVALFLTSCGKNLNPEFEAYTKNFNYTEGYNSIESGTYVYTQLGRDASGNETFSEVATTTFKRYNTVINEITTQVYYLHTETTYSGTHVQNDVTSRASDVRYYADSNSYIAKTYTNGVKDETETTYTSDSVLASYTQLFYASETSGVKSGGIYYGDYILLQVDETEEIYFKIDEDNVLIIQSETDYNYNDDAGVAHSEHYKQEMRVNSLGYLLYLNTDVLDNDTQIGGTMRYEVTYNNVNELATLPTSE